jgi:hypothetical protein
MVTIMMVFLSIPNVVNTIFSIGEVTSKSSQVEDSVSKTKISIQDLSTQTGSFKINFTLNNEGSSTLWDFDNFNVIVKYTGSVSGQRTEELSYNGECLGAVPPSGQWCIQTIYNDLADPKLLNSDEQARIRISLSENLASNSAIVTVATDNGVTYTTGGPQCESGLVLPSCYKFGTFQPTTGATINVDGLLNPSTLPAPLDVASADADGRFMGSTTNWLANGADAGLVGPIVFERGFNAYLDARFQVTNTTGSRYNIGFTSDGTLEGVDTMCSGDSCALVAIRSADATYQYIINDGAGPQIVTDSGIAESIGVVRVQVRFDSANNRVGFTINDNPEVFFTAPADQIPGSTTPLIPVVSLENSANNRQQIETYYVYVSETR